MKQFISTFCFSCLLVVCAAQDTKIRGFANVMLNTDGTRADFILGQYDSFITSQITDRISFLGETVFEFDDGWRLDVERVIIKYEWDNYLSVRCGKFHNPLGYWNNAYHHGNLIQPTILRPLAVQFEDNGGLIPNHNTGIWVSGMNMGNLKIGYDVGIGNGIGEDLAIFDDNNKKSVFAAFHLSPIKHLEVGLSGYSENFAPGDIVQEDDTLTKYTNMRLGCFHAVYMSPKFELITEAYVIDHHQKALSNSTTFAGFLYFGIPIKNVTPYFTFDNLQFAKSNVYYRNNSKQMYTLGTKYSFSNLANIKVEFSLIDDAVLGITSKSVVSFACGF